MTFVHLLSGPSIDDFVANEDILENLMADREK